MGIHLKFQRVSPYLWRKYSARIEDLNLNPLLKKYLYENRLAPTFDNRHDYFKYLAEKVIGIDDPIQYLEFGVYKGDSIREWAGLNHSTKTMFFGFDSFFGLPEDWTYTVKRGEFDLGGNVPILDDSRVKLVKGLFRESLHSFLKTFERKYRMVIHLDADLFSSTLYVLTQLDPFLQIGDVLMFDEFNVVRGEFRAFNAYREACSRSLKVIAKVTLSGWICDKAAFYLEK